MNVQREFSEHLAVTLEVNARLLLEGAELMDELSHATAADPPTSRDRRGLDRWISAARAAARADLNAAAAAREKLV